MQWSNVISSMPEPDQLVTWMPVFKLAFWIALGFFVLTAWVRSWSRGQVKTVTRAYRIFFVVICLLFGAVLTYQATWQMAGFARPEFIEFMSRYNRRPDNPTSQMIRGTIYDTRGVALALDEEDAPRRRLYPGGPAFAHVVGYENPYFGLYGVEAAEDATLRGITRENETERDNFRKNLLRQGELRGHDVTLTLRAELQRELHALMKNRKGAAVVMDPSSGAILALYSSPAFNPNDMPRTMQEQRDPDQRMFNRALHGLYPPGSTLKILTAAAALEAGQNPRYDCPPDGMRFGTGNQPIRDHEFYEAQREGRTWRGHGVLGMREALAKSSNIYFARLGVDTGGDVFYAMAERSGLTTNWMIMEGTSAKLTSGHGKFPALTADRKAETAQVSIGQGAMVTTPLHMAVIAAAIGAQGRVWQPRLNASESPRELPPMMSQKTARELAAMMRYSVQNGTGRAADIQGLEVAGKTGTAQNPHGDDHGWFIGFAPAQQAALAFAIVIEQGGYGSESALPVAAGLLKKARELGLFAQKAEAASP